MMGYQLYRMIRAGAPASWTPLMRLVAESIADDARDPVDSEPADGWPWSALPIEGYWDTRRDKWREGLTELCGMTARAISDALTSLARDGYEMREAISTDKRGRPVYAAKGHAVRFQVPPLQPRPVPDRRHQSAASDGSKGRTRVRPDGSKGRTRVRPLQLQRSHQDVQRSHSDVSKVAPGCDPVPSGSPQVNSSTKPLLTEPSEEGNGNGAKPVDNRAGGNVGTNGYAPEPRRDCPVCGGTVSVMVSGTLRRHKNDRSRWCEGAGRPPLAEAAP